MNWRDYYNTITPGSSNGYISMFDGYARNYMDPNSKYNTGLRQQFNRQGQDIASSQHAQGMKMQAAGVNPFANQQYRQASGQAREASMGAYNEAVRGNQQLGAGMLGMGLQARTQMSQQEQQHDAMARERAQHERGQWLTLGGTLLGATVMGPVASMFTKPTSIVNNMPEGMGPLATSMYQTSPEAASVQDWVAKNNINPSNLNNNDAQEYKSARSLFGDYAIQQWQRQAMDKGVIDRQTYMPQSFIDARTRAIAKRHPLEQGVTNTTTATETQVTAPRYSIPAGELESYGRSYGGNFVNNINSMLESGLTWEEYAAQQGWIRGSSQYNQLRNAARKWGW